MAKKLKAVDLFCGAGGTTSGIVQACNEAGLEVDLVAINHWNIAIDTHSRNYPKAKHLCTSLDNLNPREVVPGGHLNLLVASPECTHHSIARGGRPVNEQNRASAWCILRWAEALYIENILVENVREFMDWGPKSVDDPLGTITTTSRGVGLVEPFVVSVNHGIGEESEAGHVRRVHDLESPLPAVTTKNGYGLAEAVITEEPDPFLTKYYATAKSAQSVEEPLDTVTTKERFALVQPVVNGMKLEIRFRMLQPHELAAAQSFGPGYKFAGNKSEVTKQIGNAVPVNLARALITELIK